MSDDFAVSRRSCRVETGEDLIDLWLRSKLYPPAEALRLLPWNDEGLCEQHNQEKYGKNMSVCCEMFHTLASGLVQDLINWMHESARYVAGYKAVGNVVREYTYSSSIFTSVKPS